MIELDLIKVDVSVNSAEEAIVEAGKILYENKFVKYQYIGDMVKAYRELGPYIVIAPMIAIPHARPENNVFKNGISFLKLKNPIVFNHPTNDPVRFVLALASTDNSSHIDQLRKLSSYLADENNINDLLKANSTELIYNLLNNKKEV